MLRLQTVTNEPTTAISDTADVSPDDLRRLTALLEKYDLTELRYEQDDVRVTLRTATYFRQQSGTGGAVMLAAAPSVLADTDGSEESDDETPVADNAPGVRIEAPIMGVFYRTASPSDPPFVEVGDTVEEGQVVGLIEAMKVFSEIKSENAGIVRSIPIAHKALVQPGDALIVLDVA